MKILKSLLNSYQNDNKIVSKKMSTTHVLCCFVTNRMHILISFFFFLVSSKRFENVQHKHNSKKPPHSKDIVHHLKTELIWRWDLSSSLLFHLKPYRFCTLNYMTQKLHTVKNSIRIFYCFYCQIRLWESEMSAGKSEGHTNAFLRSSQVTLLVRRESRE